MPLFTNIGGKLMEIKSLNTTTGDILKPIYGTPKENLTLHWGGFTGTQSKGGDFLIGEFTVDSPMYVHFNCNKGDAMSEKYKDVSKVLNVFSKELSDKVAQLSFIVSTNIKYKIKKSVNSKEYHTSYNMYCERVFTKDNSGNWNISSDDLSTSGKWKSKLLSLDEGLYYVYVNKYASITPKTSDGSIMAGWETPDIRDLSGMEINLNFIFHTLSNG